MTASLSGFFEEPLEIPVRTSDTTGKDIVSAEVFLAYDGDLLTVLPADATGTLLAGDWSIETNIVDPFGDADANGSVQAFDAARVLYHVLVPFLTGLDSLSANVDLQAPFGDITPYDASLILQKRVGLIDRFEVQEDESVNHPQPETDNSVDKRVVEERVLSLRPGEGYLSVWVDNREGVVSGDLTLDGIAGPVSLSEELAGFLWASQETRDGVRIVFAGAQPVSGPGELLRIDGVGPEFVQLTRATFNDGRIGARVEAMESTVVSPRRFELHANVPNPFNPETAIRFSLPERAEVELAVFNLAGQRVATLMLGEHPAGTYTVHWEGRDDSGLPLASGVYLYRLVVQGETPSSRRLVETKSMLLLK